MRSQAQPDGGKQAQGCGEAWEVGERLSGGEQGQIAAARGAEAAPNDSGGRGRVS